MNQDPQNDRVEAPGNDDEALREYGRQLALDSMLDLALGNVAGRASSRTEIRPASSALRNKWKTSAIAACCLTALAVAVLLVWQPEPGKPPPAHPIDVVDDSTTLVITTVANWRIESNRTGAYQVLGPRRIHLDRGELRINSTDKDDKGPLLVETPAGVVTAGQTDCIVGVHEARSPNIEGPPMLNHLTRVLVLAGIASLANPHGTTSGGPGHLLAAEADAAPADHVVQANSAFALDLYGQLAREKPGKNLFFSPYSMSTALAMTAEGARGETAEQMARVLRFPEAARGRRCPGHSLQCCFNPHGICLVDRATQSRT